MDLINFSVNFFVALFALLDPIGNVPIFAAATASATSNQRRLVALYICLFCIVFLAFFYFTGLGILQFFGISMAAFRIAGGLLLFLLGLGMTRDDFLTMFAEAEDASHETADTRSYAKRRFESLIVPFAVPLMIGPGAISTVIIQADAAKHFGTNGTLAGLLVIILTGLATLLTFFSSGLIAKALGRVGMVIVVRVLGLILCALAIQFLIMGLNDTFPGVVAKVVAAPYGG